MSILVTGGAGYIGSHCVASLLEKGYDVAVIDCGGHPASLKGGRLYQGNLLDKEFVRSVFQKEQVEAVIHFAAYSLVGESMQVPEKYFGNNVGGALNLIDVMLEFKTPYLVFSSTAATFGEPKQVPIEDFDPQVPTNPYGESKLIIEKMLKWNDTAHGLKYCALRYFNVAGAWHDGSIGEDHRPETHLIPVILQVAQGKRDQLKLFGTDYPTEDGTCVRDYIHVEDLIDAHLLALEYLKKGNPSTAFNLGNGKGFSNRQIIEAARKVTGHPIPVIEEGRRAGDPAVLIASSKRAMEILGWQPKHTDVEDVIASAWKWHSTHPDGYGD